MKKLEQLYEAIKIEGMLDYERDIVRKAFGRAKYLKQLMNEKMLEKQAIESLAIFTGLRDTFIKEHLEEIKKL